MVPVAEMPHLRLGSAAPVAPSAGRQYDVVRLLQIGHALQTEAGLFLAYLKDFARYKTGVEVHVMKPANVIFERTTTQFSLQPVVVAHIADLVLATDEIFVLWKEKRLILEIAKPSTNCACLVPHHIARWDGVFELGLRILRVAPHMG